MNGKVKNSIFTEESQFEREIQRGRKVIRSFKAKADRKRTISEKFADWMTSTFGTIFFLSANTILFISWVIVNTGRFPEVKSFDPFPFTLLTTVVSLEAIILAIIVLISQNRAGKVDELRAEIDYQLGIIAEQEITKLLYVVSEIAEKNGIDLSKDEVLQQMLRPINPETIEKSLERQMERYDSSIIPLKTSLSKVLNKELLNKEINLPSLK